MFTVILEAQLNGSAVGSTCDVTDADTCEQAEALSIAAWRQADPSCTYDRLPGG
jgi:hypothetical protein